MYTFIIPLLGARIHASVTRRVRKGEEASSRDARNLSRRGEDVGIPSPAASDCRRVRAPAARGHGALCSEEGGRCSLRLPTSRAHHAGLQPR